MGCEGPTTIFETARVDVKTMKVSFEGRVPWPPPSGRSYYQRSSAQQGYTVQRFDAAGVPDPDVLSLTERSVLLVRSSNQVLLKGAYGTVYASTTHFYYPGQVNAPISFYAELGMNGSGQRPAEKIGTFDQTADLSAVSVVRVFRASPEFLVVCATYRRDGHLAWLTVNGSKGGSWVHSNVLLPLHPKLDVATSFGDRPRTREYFGLPETFPIADYLRAYGNVSTQVNLVSYVDVIHLHYLRGEYVRQDTFYPDGKRATEFLHFPVSEIDRQLRSLDDRMPFVSK